MLPFEKNDKEFSLNSANFNNKITKKGLPIMTYNSNDNSTLCN